MAFNGNKELIREIDPDIVLNLLLSLNLKDDELVLSSIELTKLKFNSNIQNSLQTINKVTDFLL